MIAELVLLHFGGEMSRWDALAVEDQARNLAVAVARRTPDGATQSGTAMTPRDFVRLVNAMNKKSGGPKSPDSVGAYLDGP